MITVLVFCFVGWVQTVKHKVLRDIHIDWTVAFYVVKVEKLFLRNLWHNDVTSGNLAFSSLFKKQNDEKHLFFPVADGFYFLSEKVFGTKWDYKGFMWEVCGKVFAVKYSVALHLTLSIYRNGCVVHLLERF